VANESSGEWRHVETLGCEIGGDVLPPGYSLGNYSCSLFCASLSVPTIIFAFQIPNKFGQRNVIRNIHVIAPVLCMDVANNVVEHVHVQCRLIYVSK